MGCFWGDSTSKNCFRDKFSAGFDSCKLYCSCKKSQVMAAKHTVPNKRGSPCKRKMVFQDPPIKFNVNRWEGKQRAGVLLPSPKKRAKKPRPFTHRAPCSFTIRLLAFLSLRRLKSDRPHILPFCLSLLETSDRFPLTPTGEKKKHFSKWRHFFGFPSSSGKLRHGHVREAGRAGVSHLVHTLLNDRPGLARKWC